MKTNNKAAGPDLDSIISGLGIGNKKTEVPKPDSQEEQTEDASKVEVQTVDKSKVEDKAETEIAIHEGRLWEEFMDILNDSEEEEEEPRTTKLYAIDDDIVETLHQCDFGGMPNVEVINSILRAFLIDNIERLRQMQRQKAVSLLDKY